MVLLLKVFNNFLLIDKGSKQSEICNHRRFLSCPKGFFYFMSADLMPTLPTMKLN